MRLFVREQRISSQCRFGKQPVRARVKSFTNEFEARFLAANESFRLAREQAFQRMAEYSSGLDFI